MAYLQSDLIYLEAASVCAIAGSVFDVKSRRIPNFITGPAILAGLVMHLVLGGWVQMLTALGAGVICGLVFLMFYLAGGMGAGDVKLILAVGCIAGISHVPYLLALTAIAGGAMGIVVAMTRGQLQQTVVNVGALAAHHSRAGLQPHPDLNLSNERTLRLPYALAIAAGILLTLYFQVQG